MPKGVRNSGNFKKGDSRINTGGRPKGVKNKKTHIKEFFNKLLEDDEVRENFTKALKNDSKNFGSELLLKTVNMAAMLAPSKYIEKEAPETNQSENQEETDFIKKMFSGEQMKVFSAAWNHIKTREFKILNNRGGTRSGKTYNTVLAMVLSAFMEKNEFLITMKSLPRIKLGPLADFNNILSDFNLEKYFTANLSNHRYTHKQTGAVFQFKSFEREQEAKGIPCDFFFMCEADGQSYGVFQQLAFRCRKGIFLDLNPSDIDCWINTEIELKREKDEKDVKTLITTYRDNPHLSDNQVHEIERTQFADPEAWKVYGTGEYGQLQHLIYPNWEPISAADYDAASFRHVVYGVDWGFNDQLASVEVRYNEKNNSLYVRQLSYLSGVSKEAETIAQILKEQRYYTGQAPVYCDSSEPAQIEVLRQELGDAFVQKADKRSISDGHSSVRACTIYIHEESKDLIKEIRSYRFFKDKDGKIWDKPVDVKNHLMDAMRYAVHTYFMQFKLGFKVQKNK